MPRHCFCSTHSNSLSWTSCQLGCCSYVSFSKHLRCLPFSIRWDCISSTIVCSGCSSSVYWGSISCSIRSSCLSSIFCLGCLLSSKGPGYLFSSTCSGCLLSCGCSGGPLSSACSGCFLSCRCSDCLLSSKCSGGHFISSKCSGGCLISSTCLGALSPAHAQAASTPAHISIISALTPLVWQNSLPFVVSGLSQGDSIMARNFNQDCFSPVYSSKLLSVNCLWPSLLRSSILHCGYSLNCPPDDFSAPLCCSDTSSACSWSSSWGSSFSCPSVLSYYWWSTSGSCFSIWPCFTPDTIPLLIPM